LKRRSAPNRSSRKQQPSDSTIFVDENVGSEIVPAALRAAGFSVEIHSDHLEQGVDDVDVLALCGARGWIFLSKDLNISRNPAERAALLGANIHAVFFSKREATAPEMVTALVPALKRLMRRFAQSAKPVHVVVRLNGTIDKLKLDA
jgi:hypothetical protein